MKLKGLLYNIRALIIGGKNIHMNIFKVHLGKINLEFGKKAYLKIGDGFGTRNNITFHVSGVVKIGEDVFVNEGCKFNCRNSIVVGKGTRIGQNVLFYDHDHDYKSDDMQNRFIEGKIEIGSNVWIGSGCIILRDVILGDNSVVAAGTVLSKGVYPANSLIYCKREICNHEIISYKE